MRSIGSFHRQLRGRRLLCGLVPIHSFRRIPSSLDRFLHRRRQDGDGVAMASLAGEEPLRAELFSVSQLEGHAKGLAGWHEVSGAAGGREPDLLLPRLRANERVLREAYDV